MVKQGFSAKEGIFKTLEMFIAAFITFLFLFVFIPQQRAQSTPEIRANALSGLRGNEGFRNCVVQQNLTCINESVSQVLEDNYDYKVSLTNNPNSVVGGLPQKRVYASSIFLAGNTTNATNTVVRLYYWSKS